MKEVKNKLRKNENKTKRNIIEERKCKKVSGGSQRIKKKGKRKNPESKTGGVCLCGRRRSLNGKLAVLTHIFHPRKLKTNH